MPQPSRMSARAGFTVEWHDELDSTNAELLRRARAGGTDRLVVAADHQTSGRGRLDRRWEAPPGSSLLFSVLLRDAPGRPHDDHRAVLAVSVALAAAVETLAGIPVSLKWPNDLVVADRKLAGVLAEREGDVLVVGAGCNVRWESFPPELAGTATACNLERDVPVDRAALLDAVLDELGPLLADPGTVLREYRSRLATLGRRVRVERPGSVLVGEAVALDDDGALVVADATGRHRILAGDVVHLRAE